MRFRLYLLTLIAIIGIGCATVRTNPTQAEADAVRAIAKDISVGTRTGLIIATNAGEFIAALPIDVKQKDAYDCAVVRVTGTTAPRPTLLTLCGTDTPQGPGPLHKALETLKTITTKPSLATTVGEISRVVQPLVVRLEASDQQVLRALGMALRVAFGLVLTFPGGAL